MRYFQKIGCLLLLLFFVFSGCESDTSTSNQGGCGDPTLHLREVSFVINGIKYNIDSLEEITQTLIIGRPGVSSFDISYNVFGLPDAGRIESFLLMIRLPRYESGIYQWTDGTSDSTAIGAYVFIDSVAGKDEKYTPISGSTNLKVYDVIPQSVDSVFGTFCGTMKNNAGASVQISDGRFFLAR